MCVFFIVYNPPHHPVRYYSYLRWRNCPGWCGSVDWAPACKAKGRCFDSQSGHMPGLWARSLVGGVWEATNECFSCTSMFLSSLSSSLPLSLKINKYIQKKRLIVLFPVTSSDVASRDPDHLVQNRSCPTATWEGSTKLHMNQETGISPSLSC